LQAFLRAIILTGRNPVSHENSYLTCELTIFPVLLLAYVWLWNVVCWPDRVVCDSFYWNVV